MSELESTNSESLGIDDELVQSLEAYEGAIDDGATGIDLPRMTVLQAMSPQLKKGGEQYIRGAEVGDFCLIGSDLADHFKDGVAAIFCDYRTHHVVWPKERGAAPPRNYFEDDSIVAKARKEGYNLFLPNGDEVVQTATWFALVTDYDPSRPIGEAGWIQAYFPLKHSGWKEHKALKKAIEREPEIEVNGRPWKPKPLFWRVWILKKASRHNRHGQDWEAWTAEPGPTLVELDRASGVDRSEGVLNLAKLFAADRIGEAMRQRAEAAKRLDPLNKAPLIEGAIAEPRG
jgi:hypothetical protein